MTMVLLQIMSLVGKVNEQRNAQYISMSNSISELGSESIGSIFLK